MAENSSPNRYSIDYAQIQSSRMYEEVAGQIQQRILRGDLQPGDKLPPEHILTREFGVSRTVIREALQSLQSRGLISVKHGSGALVCEPSPDMVIDSLKTVLQFKGATAYDLHVVRELLEVEIAGLAAQKAGPEDLAELDKILKWMDNAHHSPKEYVELDLLFHMLLAKISGNAVFLLLLQPLVDLLRISRLQAAQAPDGIASSIRGHQAILSALRENDPEEAQSVMREHLREVKERLDYSLTNRKKPVENSFP